MKKYFSILKAAFMGMLAYRASVFLNSVSNIVYIVVIYFLWKSIYSATGPVINGMSFQETFLYLALASTIFNIFKTWAEWKISAIIISGDILKDLAKPIDFQLKYFFDSTAFVIFNIFLIGLPVIVVVTVFAEQNIFAVSHFMYFIVALLLAYLISFQIDYITGLVSFYTESIWGISLTKESIVLLFSGAVVPVAFFPEGMKLVLSYLPFQYIYHAPLSILTSKDLDIMYCYKTITIQLMWVGLIFLLSRFCYSVSVKQVTVNGG